MSRICDSDPFRWFAAHLLAQLPRFHDVYNDSLAEHRRLYRIRSRSHPVPDLASEDGWLEAPFWIWTTAEPRRRRLFARFADDQLELTDRATTRLSLTLSPDGSAESAVAQLTEAAKEVKIRPRALITTMYARLLQSDVFLHGIGGGAYDRLTDKIICRFFGFQPPQFFMLSATALMVQDQSSQTTTKLQNVKRQLRELRFHPEKYVTSSPEIDTLIDEKRSWLAQQPPRGERLPRHQGIERVNLALQPHLTEQSQALAEKQNELAADLRKQTLLASREFAFCLFSEDRLKPLLVDGVEREIF